MPLLVVNCCAAAPEQLKPYKMVLWYTGDRTDTLTSRDGIVIRSWLDEGGKKLVLFSQELISDHGEGTNWDSASDALGWR